MEPRILRAEWFPRGVLIHLSEQEGTFRARWQYLSHWYEMKGPDLMKVIEDALQALEALDKHDGVV